MPSVEDARQGTISGALYADAAFNVETLQGNTSVVLLVGSGAVEKRAGADTGGTKVASDARFEVNTRFVPKYVAGCSTGITGGSGRAGRVLAVTNSAELVTSFSIAGLCNIKYAPAPNKRSPSPSPSPKPRPSPKELSFDGLGVGISTNGVVAGMLEFKHRLEFTTTTSHESPATGLTAQVVAPLHNRFAGQLHAKVEGMPSFVYLHSVPSAHADVLRLELESG